MQVGVRVCTAIRSFPGLTKVWLVASLDIIKEDGIVMVRACLLLKHLKILDDA